MTSKKGTPRNAPDEEAEAVAEKPEEQEEKAEEAVEIPLEELTAEEMREELARLRPKAQERDAIFEKLQRATADLLNYQKRMRKERESLRQFAVQDLVEALLPCLDNFDHAIAAAESSPDQSLLEGVKLVEQEFFRVLHNSGVERMDVHNAPFDPNFHEAVIQEDTDEVPHQTVLEELRAGYTLNGRVIRAAQVKVSRHPNPEQAPAKDHD